MRTPILLLVAFAAGCVETSPLLLPEGQSAIFVVASEGQPALIWAADALEEGVPVSVREEEDLYALIYPHPLEAMRLQRGKIDVAMSEPRRRLPGRAEIFAAPAGDRTFREIAARNEVLESILIASFDDAACAANGGCLRLDGNLARCELPCPRPELPQPPAPPIAPMLSAWALDPPDEVGPRCNADGWPNLDAPIVVYVRAGANAGDGSKEAPYDALSVAIQNAPDGAVIALATGEYREALVIDRPAHFVGACAESTSIVSSTVTAAVKLEQLTLASGLTVRGARVELRAVIAREARITVEAAAELDAEELLLAGAALNIRAGGRASLRRVKSSGGTSHAISVRGTASIEDLAVRNQAGSGLHAIGGADVTLDRASIHGALGAGLLIANSRAELRDVAIRETRPTRNLSGEGVVLDGAIAIAQRLSIEDARGSGLALVAFTPNARGEVTIEDLTVRDVQLSNRRAVGLEARHHVDFNARRISIDGTAREGVLVDTAVTAMRHQLEDLTIKNTGLPGFEVRDGNFDLARAAIDETGGAAVNVWRCSTRDIDGTITDLSVGSLVPRPEDQYCGPEIEKGRPVAVAIRGCRPAIIVNLALSRFQVSSSLDEAIGVCAGLATNTSLSTGRIADNGQGLWIGARDTITVAEDVIFENNREAAVHILGRQ